MFTRHSSFVVTVLHGRPMVVPDDVPAQILAMRRIFVCHFQMPLGSARLVRELRHFDWCYAVASSYVRDFDRRTRHFAVADSDSDCDDIGPIDTFEHWIYHCFKSSYGLLYRHGLVGHADFGFYDYVAAQ